MDKELAPIDYMMVIQTIPNTYMLFLDYRQNANPKIKMVLLLERVDSILGKAGVVVGTERS